MSGQKERRCIGKHRQNHQAFRRQQLGKRGRFVLAQSAFQIGTFQRLKARLFGETIANRHGNRKCTSQGMQHGGLQR